MNETSNVQKVKELFAAFARNQIAAVPSMLDENVDWQNYGPAEMGYTTPRRGRAQVMEFFKQIDELFDHEQFQADEFIAQGDHVAVTGSELVRAKSSGVSLTNQWCMIFTFRNGKIARFRAYEDTASVLVAMRGKPK
jgi:ketosteroid isomerase-like protein